jgi:hypothetical protein
MQAAAEKVGSSGYLHSWVEAPATKDVFVRRARDR